MIPSESPGTGLGIGDSVTLFGVGGGGAQTFALLPARYALLPGAYLVRPVSGYTDILPGERFERFDGSVIVSGKRSVFGTDIADSRRSGFAILPGSDVARLAR